MANLRQIKKTCEKTQYCHQCVDRDFCTQLRAKPPKYWPDRILNLYEPLEEASAKKTTKKKKGE